MTDSLLFRLDHAGQSNPSNRHVSVVVADRGGLAGSLVADVEGNARGLGLAFDEDEFERVLTVAGDKHQDDGADSIQWISEWMNGWRGTR